MLYMPERASKKEASNAACSAHEIRTSRRLMRLLMALMAMLAGPAYFFISPGSTARGNLASLDNQVSSEVAAAQLKAGITAPFIAIDPLLRRPKLLDLTPQPIVTAMPKPN